MQGPKLRAHELGRSQGAMAKRMLLRGRLCSNKPRTRKSAHERCRPRRAGGKVAASPWGRSRRMALLARWQGAVRGPTRSRGFRGRRQTPAAFRPRPRSSSPHGLRIRRRGASRRPFWAWRRRCRWSRLAARCGGGRRPKRLDERLPRGGNRAQRRPRGSAPPRALKPRRLPSALARGHGAQTMGGAGRGRWRTRGCGCCRRLRRAAAATRDAECPDGRASTSCPGNSPHMPRPNPSTCTALGRCGTPSRDDSWSWC
mmetsp:Transcript_69365/g.200967  ORF Transcript_69365/g.200967 Transcript_69365/m.200967 type:complete len:257 (-) Transcript_69365:165-935(-)